MLNSTFWEEKPLKGFTSEEWEALCDGCGKCCLHKLEDEDTEEVCYTNIACKLLNTETCQCNNYQNRKQEVPECLVLTVEDIASFHWLPSTCAYRLLAEGKPLLPWHPLLSDANTLHTENISVKDKVISGKYIHPDEFEEHIIHWVK